MRQRTKNGLKIISNNRKAKFNYFFKEFFEAGIVLNGSEVKSLRSGKANISESYAFDNRGEIFLINSLKNFPKTVFFFNDAHVCNACSKIYPRESLQFFVRDGPSYTILHS